MIKMLENLNETIFPVLGRDLNKENLVLADLTKNNLNLEKINYDNSEEFSKYINSLLKENDSKVAVGGYNEDRIIYSKSSLFDTKESPRTIHIGIDLWTSANTPIFTPLEGTMHSFQNNSQFGDYGPTIILEHSINNETFYTLYGHLTIDSLANLKQGQKIKKGQEIAKIGNYPTNGDWAPHLHFQIITDIMGKYGDFPGVTNLEEREHMLSICPNPNLLLKIGIL